MSFMRWLKDRGLLDNEIHGSAVDVFINSELPKTPIKTRGVFK